MPESMIDFLVLFTASSPVPKLQSGDRPLGLQMERRAGGFCLMITVGAIALGASV